MRIKGYTRQQSRLKLHTIFLLSALFFVFFSFFGVYTYKIYSWLWFILFFVYEALFYMGLRSARYVLRPSRKEKAKKSFELTRLGATIIFFFCIAGIISFLYFIFLYRATVGNFVFGKHTLLIFDESGRTTLEKFTLLVMQIGGDVSFIICAADHTERYKKLKTLTCVTLFLPGLRHVLLGTRFMLAADFLTFFAIKWPAIKRRVQFSMKARMQKQLIIALALVIGGAFIYLFISRALPDYTPMKRYTYYIGDMTVRPFWRRIFDRTDGKLAFIATASDYLGEAPFVFSSYCTHNMPDKIFWGLFTARSLVQIVSTLFGTGNYMQLVSQIGTGQYSGFGYTLIADFGVALSFPAALLFGRLFAVVEKHVDSSRCCHVIYPTLKVLCFFAPIYYFTVGRQDYTILFALILTPFCLRGVQKKTILEET